MKILVVCQYYYPEPFRISDICENLVKNGHHVTVLTGLPNYPEGYILDEYINGKKREEIVNGVFVKRCFEIGRGKNKIKLFLNYFSYTISASIRVFFMKECFDVILVNQLSPILMAIPAIIYKKKYQTKILLYCLDLWPVSLIAGGVSQKSIIYKIWWGISKWIYNSVDKILVTSNGFKNYFKNTLDINDEIIIEHLPQYAEAVFSDGKEKIILHDNMMASKIYNFVFAGNIGDVQSVETIIKAAGKISNRTDIFFHIVGNGSKLSFCKLLAKKLQLKNIAFYGRHPVCDMPKFYDMADAMLVTLKKNEILSYTLPGKIQSYMAAGKPIIGAINGEARRVIEEAKCGLVCAAEDSDSLAKIILSFCNSGEKQKMAKNSCEFYLQHYTQEKFMLRLEHALKQMNGEV